MQDYRTALTTGDAGLEAALRDMYRHARRVHRSDRPAVVAPGAAAATIEPARSAACGALVGALALLSIGCSSAAMSCPRSVSRPCFCRAAIAAGWLDYERLESLALYFRTRLIAVGTSPHSAGTMSQMFKAPWKTARCNQGMDR